MTDLNKIQTPEDVVDYVRQKDTEGYLKDYDKPDELIVFFFAAYELNQADAERIRAYIDLIDRVLPNFSVHEGYGGLEADNGTEAIVGALNFNMTENSDFDWTEQINAYKEAGLSNLIDA